MSRSSQRTDALGYTQSAVSQQISRLEHITGARLASAAADLDALASGTAGRLAKVSPRIVGIAWHRDRYRIPAADAFVALTQQAAEREQREALLQLGS